jgi:O-antigen/teichoic acid export membrane protein
MESDKQKNKRIAKNTMYLYIRMFFTMAISLYTSRIVLSTLGVVDYGLYNVVGGVVTMFTFINFAMGCATNRFLTFELGRGNSRRLQTVFCSSVMIHWGLALLILLLGETIGLWFLNSQMNIPTERMIAANWVYQFSIFSCMLQILNVPYDATIMSHEKMGAYAYISIYEVIMKLLIVWILTIFGGDKLIIYAILIFSVNASVRIIYQVYCRIKFKEAKFHFISDKGLLREMFTYAGWSLSGSSAVILANQGVNILLNIFFGPVINAARGVAVQVQNAIQQFYSSFQRAMAPQINKSYAEGDLKYMHGLIFSSSKYSFFLLFILSLPIVLETPFILGLWLKVVPAHTVNFIRIILCISMVNALGNPIEDAAGANGRIKKFQLIVGGIRILLIPISYLVLKFYDVPEIVFAINLFLEILALIARLFIVKPLIELSLYEYFTEVVIKIFLVGLCSAILPIFIFVLTPQGVMSFFVVSFVSMSSVCLSIYFVGLSNEEKKYVRSVFSKYNESPRGKPRGI